MVDLWNGLVARVPWMLEAGAARVGYALSLPVSALGEGLRQGVRARMPGLGTPTALPFIGADRVIARGFLESDASYAARNTGAFTAWDYAGAARSIMQQLLGFVSPFAPLMRVVNNSSGWDTYTAGADPTAPPVHRQGASGQWNWNGSYAWSQPPWWRIWTIIYPDPSLWTDAPVLGGTDALGDESHTIGLSATYEQVAAMRALVSVFKKAGAFTAWMIIALDGTLFDPSKPPGDASLPDGNWETWGKIVNGVCVPSRADGALYCDGVA